jgi:PAS domain S-box-containing protein
VDDGVTLDGVAVDEPQEFLTALWSCVPGSVLWLDSEYRILALNRELEPNLRARLLGRDILEMVDPIERQRVQSMYELARTSGQPQKFRSQSVDGRGIPATFETHVAAVSHQGQVRGYIIHSSNVTRLMRDESSLALAIRATGMGLWTFDVLRDVVEWNREMHAITGLAEPMNPFRYLQEMVHPEDVVLARQQTRRTFETGDFESAPHRIVRPDGTVRWVMVLGHVERDSRGQPRNIQGVTIDITEQKRQERALLAAQKLEAVGQLAAGIAHNFNNLLCVILPALEHWEKRADLAHKPLAEDARLAAERASNLVRQLVSFARLSNEEGSSIALDHIFEEALRVARRIVGDSLKMQTDLRDGHYLSFGPEGQLAQVIVNLAVNARDALVDAGRQEGTLRIRLHVEKSQPPLNEVHDAPTHYAHIEVEDDGPGMTPEVRERVFDPFFTTKAPGRGTGLGLSTAYATIARLGGSIECHSERGVGTTFAISVPVSESPEAAEATGHKRAEVPSTRTHLRVLVVDDEDIVRRALVNVLSQGSLHVVGARSADEALALLAESEFDVALLDRAMPGTDGITLAAGLRQSHPALRLLLVTGSEVKDEEGALFDRVLTKPVRSADLLEAVRHIGQVPG